MATVDIDALRKHIGRRTEDHDVATRAPLAGMAATFDRKEGAPAEGEPVPPGWHWAYFWAMSPRAVLGVDGLPRESDVLPEMPFPRRMFAGTDTTFHEPIRVGDKLRRETELIDISLREGGSGALIFTTIRQRIYTPRGLAVTGDRHGVFREEVPQGATSSIPKRDAPPADTVWKRTITADPVSLFRYSAMTFNPHRIHYDRTYAMQVEGYPGLVVHGPYSHQCLIDLVRDSNPGRSIATFKMRARAPLFDIAPFTVVGKPTGKDSCDAWAVTPEGTIAMQASATFA
jgi:3-methylfumaryl-CoA hydratase